MIDAKYVLVFGFVPDDKRLTTYRWPERGMKNGYGWLKVLQSELRWEI